MRLSRFAFAYLLVPACHAALFAQSLPGRPAPLTAEAIMAHVAANQDRAEDARTHYVYVQHARVISRKGKTIMCEEVTDYRVTPSSSGSHQELIALKGRLLHKHDYVTYTSLDQVQSSDKSTVDNEHDSLSISIGDDDTDRDLVENMRANLTDDKSKDGINERLFPLTSTAQGEYVFQLAGLEHVNGREVFHVVFRPKEKSEFGWKGDAYIDSTAFQPVVVRTDMARKVPLAVRTLLGTNVPGLGFSVVYAPQQDGVWLPVSFGTEFKLHVLFFFSRQIIIDAENLNFEKTHVTSKIVAAGELEKPKSH